MLERFGIHHMARRAAIGQIHRGTECALAEQPHALVGMADSVRRQDDVVETIERMIGSGQ